MHRLGLNIPLLATEKGGADKSAVSLFGRRLLTELGGKEAKRKEKTRSGEGVS